MCRIEGTCSEEQACCQDNMISDVNNRTTTTTTESKLLTILEKGFSGDFSSTAEAKTIITTLANNTHIQSSVRLRSLPPPYTPVFTESSHTGSANCLQYALQPLYTPDLIRSNCTGSAFLSPPSFRPAFPRPSCTGSELFVNNSCTFFKDRYIMSLRDIQMPSSKQMFEMSYAHSVGVMECEQNVQLKNGLITQISDCSLRNLTEIANQSAINNSETSPFSLTCSDSSIMNFDFSSYSNTTSASTQEHFIFENTNDWHENLLGNCNLF